MAVDHWIDETRPLLLVGCGNMGRAMARGWLANGLKANAFYGLDPVVASGAHEFPEGSVKAQPADLPAGMCPSVIVLAVKPQMMKAALSGLSECVAGACTILSVAAGTDLAVIQDALPGAGHYIRAMPNTPAAVGKGLTGLYADPASRDEVGSLVEELVSTNGSFLWLDEESQINALTAVSGSGPAYLFYLAEALAGAAEAEGFSPDVAARLARETMIGAAALLEQDDASASDLRTRVTSPGGTTAAALDILMEGGAMTRLMREAVRAARRRGEELSKL